MEKSLFHKIVGGKTAVFTGQHHFLIKIRGSDVKVSYKDSYKKRAPLDIN